ncbi:LamG-like jellyroll fold domain-containing protein [Luteolibacter marinus]|uniref:LamG-like jellyroll fold domain-containing protein n=1 Tax=Luteolibacter marinus TaxID=2776705 RepID=UPI001865D4FA|nr:LamG-like jellyroll fold domain-containing protein [Luteolibacter marinus]
MIPNGILKQAAVAACGLAVLSLPAAAQAYGLSERPDVEAYFDGTFPEAPPSIPADWTTVEAFPNLSFLNPVGLTSIPGTNKLLVWEREGRIYAFDNDPAVSTKTLVVDLSPNTQGWDDSGLLGVAVHPDFATNRQIYVWYNWRGGQTGGAGDLGPIIGNPTNRPPTNTPTRDRLSRFELDASFQTSQANEYVVIDQQDQTVWHNGGGMFFHPENGFLYIANGDDQNSGLNGQRIDRALFSGVLRIDVDLRGGAISHAPTKRPLNEVSPSWPRYYVPNDNPFVGQPDALEEFFAIGLRSPHRMTVDPVTGRIFIGDVGAGSREEISVIEPSDPAGLNLQWPRIEGLGGDLTAPYIGVSKRPIIDYGHGDGVGSCVVGGYVYRGTEFPELYGKYIFGDNMTGFVWYLDESTAPATKVFLAQLPDGIGENSGNDYRGLGSFGVDANHELYLCQLGTTEGKIFKLERGGPPPGTPLPATLGATGLFDDLATMTPSPKLIHYELNAPFWSDGAIKTRYAMVPNGTTIEFNESGEWTFPAGSVLVKHFELPVSDVDPGLTRKLETRFLVKRDDGTVYGATYKWRADQSDADLLDGGLTESVAIATTPIGALTSQDIGSPALAGSTVRNGDQVTITAGGNDIWGTSDQFHFAHQLRTGDFDVAVRVASVTQADLYTKTGLMVRESLDANAAHVMALVFPSNAARNNNDGGYEFQYRATAGGNATALYPPQPQPRVAFPDTWLRMTRAGDTFTAYSSSDGFTWTEYASTTLSLPAQIYFGLAVTAHTASPTTTAVFQVDSRRQPWYFPSRQDCVTCHNPQAGGTLGPSTRQFNRDLLFPNATTDNQIRAWNHVGLFDNGPAEGDIPSLEKLSDHDDTSATLQQRARSYLDANCSYCHRPGGVQAFWDARYETPFPDQGIYYGPVADNLGNPDGRVVVPQSLANSILHHRVSKVGENQMPPLAKNKVDEDGVAMLTAWIESLPTETVIAPDTLAATAVSHTQVNLSWLDLSDNEAGFLIERSLDGVNFTSIHIAAPDETSYSDIAAEPFLTNYYRVAAFGSYVYSGFSNVASAVPDVGPPAPEIHITGNGEIIANNDTTPSMADGTDFGVTTPLSGEVIRSFTLANIGNATLQLGGSPVIRLDGANAGDFSVVAQPAASLAGPGSVVFEIRFSPLTYGTKLATVVIESDDASEPTTSFSITGIGLDDGVVAWWRFDETSGTTAADGTGFGHAGTLTQPLAQWDPTGRIGGALRFTGELNQSVTVADEAALNPTSAISITAWVKASDWNGNRRVLQKGNNDNQYRLLAEGGDLVWEIANVGRIETALPPANEWFHLAATYDGALMRVYVNGLPVAAQAETGAIPVTGDPIYLGTKTPGSIAGDHFNGWLDELSLYNRALGSDEVGEQAGLGIDDGLLGWWKLDETGGTIASDATTGGNDGTLTAPLPEWETAGRLGGALRFNGSLGQSVTIPDAPALNPANALSISTWVYSLDWNGNRRLLQKGNGDNQYRLLAEGGQLVWDIENVGRISAALPALNQWVHVAGTYDGARMTLYTSGVEVASQPATGLIPATADALHLGTKSAGSGTPGNFLNGTLDDVRIYERSLSELEIGQLAAQLGSISITATDASAQKGAGDPGVFTITRTGPTTSAVAVALTLATGPGQAVQGSDYTLAPTPGTFVIPAGQTSAEMTVTPLDTIAVTAARTVGLTLGETTGYLVSGDPHAEVVVQDSPLNLWKIYAFGGLAAAQGPGATDTADIDADGLDTLLEAALGGSPGTQDSELLPVSEVELIDGQLYLTSTYTRPKPALAGISYVHRRTIDLNPGSWQAAEIVTGYPVDNLDGTETVKIRSALPVGGAPKQFLRLEITRP